MLSLLASLLMFFRPLLSGIVRALVLAVRPRPYRARGNKACPAPEGIRRR
jgi:hypothetical protein